MMYAIDEKDNTREKVRQRVIGRLSADKWIVNQEADGHIRAEHWLAGFHEDVAHYGDTGYMTYRFMVLPGSESQHREDYENARKTACAVAEMNRKEIERQNETEVRNGVDRAEGSTTRDVSSPVSIARQGGSTSVRHSNARVAEGSAGGDTSSQTVSTPSSENRHSVSLSTTNITESVEKLGQSLKNVFSF